jgi:methionyl aminopeptidase
MFTLGNNKGITIKSPEEINLMRISGQIVARTMEKITSAAKPGVTTTELDQIAEDDIRSQDAVPSFKGYLNYPATICTSINNELVHGIPSDRKIQDGDILSIDAGAVYKGFHSDHAVTIPIGSVPKPINELIKVTRESLLVGIKQAVAGARIGDVSHSIQEYIESNNFGVVREYVGHGIGRQLHEDPPVPNFGEPSRGLELKRGLVLAIEPMVTVGDWHTKLHEDGWTVSTLDESLCAHFEHTILITDHEAEVLTTS